MKFSKLKSALIIPIGAYIVFMLTLYNNTTIASTAFFILVISLIAITILGFRRENDIKETQRA